MLIAGLTACIAHLEWLGRETGGSGDRRSLILAGYEAMVVYERDLTDA